MESIEEKDLSKGLLESLGIQPNWVLIVPVILMLLRGIPSRVMTMDLKVDDLEKKARLLSRLRGYMTPEEQSTLHRAETILHIISKTKDLFEITEGMSVQAYDPTLTLEDRKRHMLMDISEFVDEEKQRVISKAIDLHRKASTVESRMPEIREMANQPINLDNFEHYIDIFEPLLENEMKNKAKELRVTVGVGKLLKSLGEKRKLEEGDIFEMVQTFMSSDQRKQIEKMMQIFKMVNAIGDLGGNKEADSQDQAQGPDEKEGQENKTEPENEKVEAAQVESQLEPVEPELPENSTSS